MQHMCVQVVQSLKKALDKLMFIVIGARDFSPEITVHLIGTKVPCSDKVPPPQIPILGHMWVWTYFTPIFLEKD